MAKPKSHESNVKAFIKALPERLREVSLTEITTNEERADAAQLCVDLFALIRRTQSEDAEQNSRDLITDLCHFLQRQVQTGGEWPDQNVDLYTGLASESWVLSRVDMALDTFIQEHEAEPQDDWDKMAYPDLTDGQNLTVRVARRQGFALFFPNTDGGNLTYAAAVRHLIGLGWTTEMVTTAEELAMDEARRELNRATGWPKNMKEMVRR